MSETKRRRHPESSPQTDAQRAMVRQWVPLRSEGPGAMRRPSMRSRYQGAMVGLAAGDALGTTIEFRKPGTFTPVTEMMGGGPFRLLPGQWTDDTSMALCLGESLVTCGSFDAVDQLERYQRWAEQGHWSSNGTCFDIGNVVRQALATFRRTNSGTSGPTDENTAGNGSLMRLAPVPLYWADDPSTAIHFAGESSRTTHGTRMAIDAVARGTFREKHPPAIRGTGFVVESLEAALWAYYTTDSFREGALAAVNLGDDTDTTGAIFGQLAGVFYGVEAIPVEWREKLTFIERIEEMAVDLMSCERSGNTLEVTAAVQPPLHTSYSHSAKRHTAPHRAALRQLAGAAETNGASRCIHRFPRHCVEGFPGLLMLACGRRSNCSVVPAILTRAERMARCGAACAALLSIVGCDNRALGTHELVEADSEQRPSVHFTPRENWVNDPNGPVYLDGRYHLFYQYNPYGGGWGNMSWGHASSTDLVRWREEPVAITRTDSTLIFSGGVVIDSLGSSGLCRGPRCLIAIYTAAHVVTNAQSQSLAFSEDGGTSWSQFQANPVLDIGSTDFRDPYVFWHAPSEAWVMVVALATEHVIRIYRSSNLREWTLASEFGPRGATGGVWECPVLLELPVENAPGTSRWMLKIDLNPGHIAGGSGAQYFVGAFDGQHFNAPLEVPAQWVDFGPDFYCAQPWTRGKQVTWIAWMSNWQYAGQTPTAPWRGSMTFPRTLALREVGGSPRLVQRPVASLDRFRGLEQRFTFSRTHIRDVTPLSGFDSGDGDAYELRVHIEPGDAHEVGVLLRYSQAQHVLVSYDVAAGTIAIDRRPVPAHDFHPAFLARHSAALNSAAPIVFRLIVDHSSVELFADDGATVLTSLMFPDASSNGLALFSKGGAVDSVSVQVWPLQTPR